MSLPTRHSRRARWQACLMAAPRRRMLVRDSRWKPSSAPMSRCGCGADAGVHDPPQHRCCVPSIAHRGMPSSAAPRRQWACASGRAEVQDRGERARRAASQSPRPWQNLFVSALSRCLESRATSPAHGPATGSTYPWVASGKSGNHRFSRRALGEQRIAGRFAPGDEPSSRRGVMAMVVSGAI